MPDLEKRTDNSSPEIYDCLIIGGGPAGLSAAIYLARYDRKCAILDSQEGRSTFSQTNENYLGFPDGISSKQLRELGRRQAQKFGAKYFDADITSLDFKGNALFEAKAPQASYLGRTVLFATGVTDVWPSIANIENWIGKQVFWCITCDGHRAKDKKVLCIGSSAFSCESALKLRQFTRDITFILKTENLSELHDNLQDMQEKGVTVLRGKERQFKLQGERIVALQLEDRSEIPFDMLFSFLGINPNNSLAKHLGVAIDSDGYIIMNEDGFTNVRGVFAAGDVASKCTHQVVSAAHAGSEAALAVNRGLYALEKDKLTPF